ncbi:transcription factor bHLH78-like [Zingiber officinale]|uniref:BHLH domain-containing protein n=1 Tax=Zingiber officinale TaxID=94328 RepID=A0A8J5GSP5_ZINOF|nr:transcription factor bHLH78-like [Zingiber officinale]XP_042381311.1 transcription factor bHLH78-like [Zingiber officinale]KAG6509424.1 hypothetical protein ZIOFF_027414 [Zingiber officinale]
MYCGQPDQLLDLNWNQGMGPSGHLESSLSSVAASSFPAAADGMAFHKLMGGLLPNVGNSGESRPIGVRLNSPNKLHPYMPKASDCLPLSGIPMMPASHLDQFSGRTYGHLAAQLGILDAERLSRVSTLQIGLPEGRKETSAVGGLRVDINNAELLSGREEYSASNPAASGELSLGGPSKKRKAPPRDKVKATGIANSAIDPPTATEEEDPSSKRCRSTEKNGTETDAVKPKEEQNDGCSSNKTNGHKQGNDNSSKSGEPPKDYIHVRARRGQATDSHSLAERVRREKISQRMKLLQDLVPGCNKVTGKAVMLDEIINYVQSLQHQVEFLSMKLATVNPQSDFNFEALIPKDMHQTCGPMPNSVYSLETSEVTAPYIHQPQQGTSLLHSVLPNDIEIQNSLNMLEPTFHRTARQPFISGFDTTSSQLGAFWEDDLEHN